MKTYSTLLFSALIALLSLDCSKKNEVTDQNTGDYSKIAPTDTSGAQIGDWIIQRELADPQSLNPVTLQDATGREFSLHIFERLMWAAGREDYELVPWIAEAAPEETPDHLTYTYRIKKNITFSDGKPLT